MDNSNENKNNKENIIKVLFCGDSAVGKTALIERLKSNQFLKNQISTIGVDYRSIYLTINEQRVEVQINDISGQDRYHSICRQQVRNVDGVVYVYDVSELETFFNIEKVWIKIVDDFAKEDVETILLGNKCDKINQVPYNKGNEFAQEKRMQFFETSAMTGKDVHNSIESLACKIYLQRVGKRNSELNEQKNDQKNIQLGQSNKSKQYYCCSYII